MPRQLTCALLEDQEGDVTPPTYGSGRWRTQTNVPGAHRPGGSPCPTPDHSVLPVRRTTV